MLIGATIEDEKVLKNIKRNVEENIKGFVSNVKRYPG
jgi:hypothetical protein